MLTGPSRGPLRHAALGSVGVGVIVLVGNYIVAAFNEACGTSTCDSGFHFHVETSASP